MQIVAEFPEPKPWRFGANGLDLYEALPFVWVLWNNHRADYGSIWAPEQDPEQEEGPTGIVEPDADIPEYTVLQLKNNIIKSGVNISATIECSVKEPGHLSVIIYDSKGKEVIVLYNDHYEIGIDRKEWVGTDSSNNKIGSGIYLVNMECGGYKETKKIAVIK